MRSCMQLLAVLAFVHVPAVVQAQVWQMWVHHDGAITKFDQSRIDSITFVLADTTMPGTPVISATPGVDAGSITVSWVAVGDDGGSGTVASQELRVSPVPGTPFEGMTPVPGLPPPHPAGTSESFTVTGLTQNQLHCFRLRVVDEFGNTATSEEACATAPAAAGAVVIAEVYGGAGTGGGTYNQDYVVLFNRTAAPISLENHTIQFAPSGSTSWTASWLSGLVIGAHAYFLIACGPPGGPGQPLPAQDFFMGGNITTAHGKVALLATNGGVGGSCPPSGLIVDLVGYGMSDCFETAAAPILSFTTAARRKQQGCQDTGDNAADFVAGSPTPRHSGSPPMSCP